MFRLRCAVRFLGLVVVVSAAGDVLAEPGRLAVTGYRDAAILAPVAKGKTPVIFGFHGNFDRPEWFCGAMEALVRGRVWMVCPRGRRRTDVPKSYDRYTYPNRPALRREARRGLKALSAAYAGRVDDAGPYLLAGFSLGAIYAARFAVAEPKKFPRLYLVEGSHHVWTAKAIRRFARRGGKEVLFGCGRRGCAAQSRRICRALRRRKVACQTVLAKGLGHGYDGPLLALVQPRFDALLRAHLAARAATPTLLPSNAKK